MRHAKCKSRHVYRRDTNTIDSVNFLNLILVHLFISFDPYYIVFLS